jgi:exopolysaccharide production protein ExoZ
MKPDRSTLHGIQILRGIAAILVVACHVAVLLGPGSPIGSFEVGGFGVDLFFPISGVVIYYASSAASWQVFLVKRLVRVVPIYWMFTALKLAVVMAAPALVPGFTPGLWHSIASFLFIPAHNFRGEIVPVILVGWTLDFEMYFYLVCVLALALAPRRAFALVSAAIIIAMIAIFLPFQPSPEPAPLLVFNPICFEFLAGFVVAYALDRGLRVPPALSVVLTLAAVAWVIWAPELPGGMYRLSRPLTWGIPGATIVFTTVMLERNLPFRKLRLANVLGNASYSIYLSHQATLPLVGKLVRRLVGSEGWLPLLSTLVACTALGVATHFWVERPLTVLVSSWFVTPTVKKFGPTTTSALVPAGPA